MSYSSEVLADSPRWWLRLGEASGTTATDSSGNSRNGTYTNTGGITYSRTGLPIAESDTGILLNGSTGYVDVPDTQAYSSVTMEAWVKPSDTTNRVILVQSDGNPSTTWSLSLRTNGGKFEAHVFTGSAKVATAPSTYTTGTTYHVSATATSSGSLLLYINGALVTTTTSLGTIFTGANSWQIGKQSGGGFGYWNADVDEVALYTTVLSAARLLAHYNVGSTPATPISGSDTPTISAADSSTVVAVVSVSATDTPTISVSETAAAQTATPIVGADSPTVAITETAASSGVGAMADTLSVSVTESHALLVDPLLVSGSDAPAASLTESYVLLADPALIVASDTLDIAIGERSAGGNPSGIATRFTSSYLPVG